MGASRDLRPLARHQPHAERDRARDPAQPGVHVHDPGDLDRRASRRPRPAARRSGRRGRARSRRRSRGDRRRLARRGRSGRLRRAARSPRSRSRARSTRWSDRRGRVRDARRPATAELEERGSRFLAIAEPVLDRAGAEAFFERETRAQRNPTHVVPAFRLRDGTEFSSDAGEPAGSAGAPLLAALGGADLHDVAAVVVRWYGGTNLGVGGLVRAYGGALARALDGAPGGARRARGRGASSATATSRRPRSCAASHGTAAAISTHAYGEQGVELRFRVPLARCDALGACLRDATRGAVTLGAPRRVRDPDLGDLERERLGRACPRRGARRGCRADRSRARRSGRRASGQVASSMSVRDGLGGRHRVRVVDRGDLVVGLVDRERDARAGPSASTL